MGVNLNDCRRKANGQSYWFLAGKQVFAARVNLPAVVMPGRSYLRSSLAEMADAIADELSAAVADTLRGPQPAALCRRLFLLLSPMEQHQPRESKLP